MQIRCDVHTRFKTHTVFWCRNGWPRPAVSRTTWVFVPEMAPRPPHAEAPFEWFGPDPTHMGLGCRKRSPPAQEDKLTSATLHAHSCEALRDEEPQRPLLRRHAICHRGMRQAIQHRLARQRGAESNPAATAKRRSRKPTRVARGAVRRHLLLRRGLLRRGLLLHEVIRRHGLHLLLLQHPRLRLGRARSRNWCRDPGHRPSLAAATTPPARAPWHEIAGLDRLRPPAVAARLHCNPSSWGPLLRSTNASP